MENEHVEERRPYQSFRSAASNNWRNKDDSPRAERPQYQKRDQRQSGGQPGATSLPSAAEGTRLYVGNLLYSAKADDVEALFTENGFTVASVSISTDPFSGRNPSYCFVDLGSPDEATRAMNELNGKEVLGRAVRINPGVAKKAFGQGTPETRVKNYNDRRGGQESRSRKSSLT